MKNQLVEQLQSPLLYDLAVINLLQSMGYSREQIEQELRQRIILRRQTDDSGDGAAT